MHPFLDGNGRTARALEALVLQRAGLLTGIPLVDETLYTLAHEGVRRCVLEAMVAEERRKVHDGIAALLERRPDIAPAEDALLHRARGSDWRRAHAVIEEMQREIEAVRDRAQAASSTRCAPTAWSCCKRKGSSYPSRAGQLTKRS